MDNKFKADLMKRLNDPKVVEKARKDYPTKLCCHGVNIGESIHQCPDCSQAWWEKQNPNC